ncbi:MAG TPA: HlyD family secretion protein [Nitrospirota bacterium]|nr:HlyD family secretion protein [Nitrospirota bacterium]
MAEEQAPNPQTGDNQKKKKAFMIVGAVLVTGLIIGYFYVGYRKTHVSTDDAFIDGNIHTIAAKISGTVKEIYVTDNQPIKKGDLLLDIDPADYSARFREASSVVNAEKAKLDEAETKIAAARADLELQRANLKLADIEKRRAENLYQKEVIPRDRYDRAMTAYEVAVAQVKAAEEQLRSAESQRLTQVSTVRQKEATATLAELNYQYTKIYAPADGYITKKSVQTGNQIQAGQPLMAVVPLSDIWVTANFKETQMENIRPGQAVKIKVDSYPGKVFQGRIDSIMAGTGVTFSLFPPENATGNYVKVVQRIPVKIVFEEGTDKEHVLRIGMSVDPTVIAK